jgi:hypothetical protein
MPDRLAANESCSATLTPGERLVLQGLRCWAASRMRGGRPVAATWRLMAWRTSERVAALFVAWMEAVEAGGRHPIQIHCVRCAGATADEQRLILAMGVASVDMELGESLLAPLVTDCAAVMTLARALNAALASSGLPLLARLCGAPVRHEVAGATVH